LIAALDRMMATALHPFGSRGPTLKMGRREDGMAKNDNDTTNPASNNERSLPASTTLITDVRETEVPYARTPPPRQTDRGIHPRRSVPPLPDED
jgi:hypothetical protein